MKKTKGDCRKYPTSYSSSVGYTENCTYNKNSSRLICNANGVVTETVYAGTGDFVHESKYVGARRWLTQTVTGAAPGTYLTTNTYSEDKRVTLTVSTVGGTTSTSSPTVWDDKQRVLSVTGNYTNSTGSTCSNRIETITYDDKALKATNSISYASTFGTGAYAGSPCTGFSSSTKGYWYDENMNLIASDSATYTILSTAEVCE